MNINKTKLYGLYLLVITLFVILNYLLNQYVNNKLASTYYINLLLHLLTQVMPIIFGGLLGLEHIIKEFNSEGKWFFDSNKFVIIGLPSLIIAFLPTFLRLGIIFAYGKITIFLLTIAATKMLNILFGYILITSFSKKKE